MDPEVGRRLTKLKGQIEEVEDKVMVLGIVNLIVSAFIFAFVLLVLSRVSGCALTTAEYKDGVASIRRIRVLMTEDIDSFTYDATDGSFILEGYKSDMTRLLILVDKLISKDAELRYELLALRRQVK